MRKILTIVLTLAVGFSAVLVVASFTEEIILKNQLAGDFAEFEVLGNDLVYSDLDISKDATGLIQVAYLAENDTDTYYLFKIASAGYNSASPILFSLAIDEQGNIVLYTVTQIEETVGLGSKVADEAYQSYVQTLTITDTLDGISGATVSSGAIAKGVEAAVTLYTDYVGQ